MLLHVSFCTLQSTPLCLYLIKSFAQSKVAEIWLELNVQCSVPAFLVKVCWKGCCGCHSNCWSFRADVYCCRFFGAMSDNRVFLWRLCDARAAQFLLPFFVCLLVVVSVCFLFFGGVFLSPSLAHTRKVSELRSMM